MPVARALILLPILLLADDAMTSFSMPKGEYQVREVVREAMENHMTAVNSPVTVR